MSDLLNGVKNYILKSKTDINKYNLYIIHVLNNNDVLKRFRGLNNLKYKYIKDKILYIYETESSIKFVLERKKNEIIAEINKYFNEKVIEDITVITKNYDKGFIRNNNVKKRKIVSLEFNEKEYLKRLEKILEKEKNIEKKEELSKKILNFQRNRINMINSGYIPCEMCKNLFYTEYEDKKICIRCANKIEKVKYSLIYNELKRNIKISYEQIIKKYRIERLFYERVMQDIINDAQNDMYNVYNNLINNMSYYNNNEKIRETEKLKEKIKKYLYIKYKGADPQYYKNEELDILNYYKKGILEKLNNENDI